MRNKLIPTNRYNPCPLCTDHTGDCRISGDTMILCHGYIDTDSPLSGWKWTKATDNGVWGVHVVDDEQKFNREQWERDNALREQQKCNREQFLANYALPIPARDTYYKKLANYLGLDQQHRIDLLSRGLTETDIDSLPYFSVNKYSPISSGIPNNLPGIGTDYQTGNPKLCVTESGYFCPSFDINGQINGGQIRYFTKNNKYRWLKGVVPSHLPNAELPISVVKGKNESNILYLTEGILKPLIASKRLGIDVCGAAGGHFSGSPTQFTEILAHYDTIILCPDARDVINPQVMKRWLTQINFIQSLGFEVNILWWGQITKESKDLDEIDETTFSEAKPINLTEFQQIASKEQYINQCWQSWIRSKEFQASIKIQKKFFDYDLESLPPNIIAFIRSGLGSGKTTRIKKLLAHLREYGAISLGYRNTLLLQFCESTNDEEHNLKFYHLHHDNGELHLANPQFKLALCIDSILRLQPEDFDGKIIILDEVVSILKHLFFSNTIRNRVAVIDHFGECIRRADRVFCLDGLMCDWVVKFFKNICPNKDTITIENTHQGKKANLYLLQGMIDFKGKLKKNAKEPWLELLLNESYLPAICSDSQLFLEALENLLMAQGRTGLRVDSTTVNEKSVKEFLANSTQYLKDNHLEYLLYSPSAESGLDVSITDYFTEHFGFFFGVIDCDSIIQMIGRIRDINVDKYIWVRDFSIIADEDVPKSPLSEVIDYHLKRRLKEDLHLVMSGQINETQIISEILEMVNQNQTSDYQCAVSIQAMQTHERHNLRRCLAYMLKQSGYEVENVTSVKTAQSKAIKEDMKNASEEVKTQKAHDIFNGSDKYIGQPDVRLNFDASWTDRCAVIKAKIINQLPGINETNYWDFDLIKKLNYDEPCLVNQLELLWMLFNPEKAKQLSLIKYNKLYQKGMAGERIALWKLRQQFLEVNTLIDIGFVEFLKTATTYHKDSDEVREIHRLAQLKRHKGNLGVKVDKDPIRFINKLIKRVGGEVVSRKEGGRDNRINTYTLKRPWLDEPIRETLLKCIEEKFNRIICVSGELEWGQNARKIPEQVPAVKNASEVDSTRDKACPDTPLNVDNQEEHLDTEKTVPEQELYWDDIISDMNRHLKRIGWTIDKGIQYLLSRYGVKSRQLLTDAQIIEFWDFLKMA